MDFSTTIDPTSFISNLFMDYGVLIIMIIAFLLLIAAVVFGLIIYFRQRKKIPRALDQVLLHVRVRKEAIDEDVQKQDPKELIGVMEPLLANLASIQFSGKESLVYGKEYLSLEIASLEGKIGFYVTVPRHLVELVEKQINASYSDALIERVPQYNIFSPKCATTAVVMQQVKDPIYPIRTYQKLEGDPLNGITNTLSKLGKSEGAVIQIMLVPSSGQWRERAKSVADKLAEGGSGGGGGSKILSRAGDVVFGAVNAMNANQQSPQQPEQPEMRLAPMDEEKLEGLGMKASKMDFKTVIRIVTAAPNEGNAEMNMGSILSAFMQFSSPNLNGLKPIKSWYLKKPWKYFVPFANVIKKAKERKIIKKYIFRYFPWRKKEIMVLNTEELASIFHFPNKNLDTPNVEWIMSKQAAPPTNLPANGVILGESDYRGEKKLVRIDDDDRRRHMYMIGRTGTGKSEFLANMAAQDIRNGKGVCVIDPHGDLIDTILTQIPPERVKDVVLFDPSDTERPMGLNMLEFHTEFEKDFVVGEMISIFHKLYEEFLGPRFDHIVRNAFLTIMADPASGSTMLELPRIITDPNFQRLKLAKLTDPVVQAFWDQEMAQTTDFHKSEMLGPVISKIGAFMTNRLMRNIIGQQKSTFNIQEIMDNGKILLVKLSKGKIGELNMKLLGLIIVAKIQMGAMARARMPKEKRRDFYLYVDEFQNFATDSFESILSEARKYALNLIIAHQYIAQIEQGGETYGLKARLREAVFGNVGTILCGRIGAEDAEIMEKIFQPAFDQHDLLNIDKFHAYVVLSIDNVASKPFDMAFLPPVQGGDVRLAELVKQTSSMKYGVDAKLVDQEVLNRLNIGKPMTPPPVSKNPLW